MYITTIYHAQNAGDYLPGTSATPSLNSVIGLKMDGPPSAEIICEIFDRIEHNKILHKEKVNYAGGSQDPHGLTELCEGLRKMKSDVNASLTGLVEKEKGLNPSNVGENNGEMDLEEEESSESGEQ